MAANITGYLTGSNRNVMDIGKQGANKIFTENPMFLMSVLCIFSQKNKSVLQPEV